VAVLVTAAVALVTGLVVEAELELVLLPNGLRDRPVRCDWAGVVRTLSAGSGLATGGGPAGTGAWATGAGLEESESRRGIATIAARRITATGHSFFVFSSLPIPRKNRETAEKSRSRFIAPEPRLRPPGAASSRGSCSRRSGWSRTVRPEWLR
jgi:hypothetical protein